MLRWRLLDVSARAVKFVWWRDEAREPHSADDADGGEDNYSENDDGKGKGKGKGKRKGNIKCTCAPVSALSEQQIMRVAGGDSRPSHSI